MNRSVIASLSFCRHSAASSQLASHLKIPVRLQWLDLLDRTPHYRVATIRTQAGMREAINRQQDLPTEFHLHLEVLASAREATLKRKLLTGEVILPAQVTL